MIKLTRINDEVFFLNCDIIEYIEEVPHTVIKTTTDHTYVVVESVADIIQEIIEFKKQISHSPSIKQKGN